MELPFNTKLTHNSLIIMLQAVLNKFWKHNPKNSHCTVTNFPSHKPSKSDEQNIYNTAGEVRMNS